MALKIRKQKMGDDGQLDIAQELYKKNAELADRNQTLQLLQDIDKIVLSQIDDPVRLAANIVNVIQASTDFPLISILVKPNIHARHFETLAFSATTEITAREDFIKRFSQVLVHGGELLGKGKRSSLGKGEIVITDDVSVIQYSPLMREDITFLEQHGSINSVFICPLRARSKLNGVLIIGSHEERHHISESRKNLVTRISTSMGLAFDSILLIDQIQEANQRLKELDKAKDDFISMASHQLRTPLTTVKGYLSMVLEGDVGKVNKEQQRLINMAFGSAERMVYLITDLLNVSRLNTGKFVIDKKEFDLAEVVQSEVNQLQNHASNKQIELVYEKPKQPMVVHLDEGKLRQVIMNFTDNAIYYTPEGGRVEVKLSQTEQSIELRVVDNGIGVPKEQQHKLFTKFYRADNARQARPDGTGLGIFMAKKVILAQGGALIFHSQEGEGSTFGFTFPLANAKPPIKSTSASK